MEIAAKTTLSILLVFWVCVSTAADNHTDKLALLDFKSHITKDPLEILTSWNDSTHFCHWYGIKCNPRVQRVAFLELPSLKLQGTLSPHIGNLTFLRSVDIQNNGFQENIPPEIGNLLRLEFLGLENNSFTGTIPTNISQCRNLQMLRLGSNQLIGKVPEELSSLVKLQELYIYFNNLSGEIPSSFGNLSSLQVLSAAGNELSGKIPESLGKLQNLYYLALGANNLSGTVPPSIFNLSSIVFLHLPQNNLEGQLPSDLGFTLPNLQVINVADNHLTGPIPYSISNASNLMRLTLPLNRFSGRVPTFENLYKLSWVSISQNQLGNGGVDDLYFIESLINSTGLVLLAIDNNNFGGVLPESLGKLSNTLNILSVENNQISGSVPSGIGELENLEVLYLGNNRLSGEFPESIGNIRNLKDLQLFGNQFTGNIPASLGYLTLLTKLTLDRNNFSGKIPQSLGNCKNLLLLDLSNNNFSGDIPPEIVSISSLAVYLDLSRNRLTGLLPMEIGSLTNLAGLDVSENELSGEIPSSLGKCISLEQVFMRGNFFTGQIPSTMSSMRGLRTLDLSHNNLSGPIPEFLSSFPFLRNLSLSDNHLEGEVPRKEVFSNSTAVSLSGNLKLCGGISEFQLPNCSTRKLKHKRNRSLNLILPLVSGAVLLILILAWIMVRHRIRNHRRKTNSEDSPLKSFFQVSYDELQKATNGFSPDNLIGSGRFSSVYKGTLDGNVVAVKVINLTVQGASRSFLGECEALRNVRHRNLVKIVTACASIDFQGNDFKALVYECLENGSLEEWLHPPNAIDGNSRYLNLLQRVGIAIDVASAVDYLHVYCKPAIVHCDLKPSNVLLDGELTGHVGDFGIARVLIEETNNAMSTAVRGTVGYTAPEYGMGSGVSAMGDTYSLGVLLLEMFTGKRPTDEMFNEGLNLHSYVKTALPEKLVEITDIDLLKEVESSEETRECLVSLLEIGVSCSKEVPWERMAVADVEVHLRSIKKKLVRIRSEDEAQQHIRRDQ